MKLIFIIIIISCFNYSYQQKLEVKNLNNEPLLLTRINECRIQTGMIKLVHPIDLGNLERTINNLNSLAKNFKDQGDLFKMADLKIKNLYNNLLLIKPIRRVKRWDAIGTGWKWLAGSPDAQDLHIINRTMTELIHENNAQIKVNYRIDRRFKQLTDTMNQVINITNIGIVTLKDVELLKLIININHVNEIILNIQDAILETKVSVVNGRILATEEIMKIKELLFQQGLETEILEEALKFVKPKIVIRDEVLLYIIEVPQLGKTGSIMLVNSLINDDKRIKEYPDFLVQIDKELFTTNTPNNLIQLSYDIKKFEDTCIHPLILGQNSTCTFIVETDMEIKLIVGGKLLINNGKNIILSSDCGPENITLNGNFLVTFENCTIRINGQTFTATQLSTKIQDVQGIFYNTKMTKEILNLHSISGLRQETVNIRNEIQELHDQHKQHKIWLWSSMGKTSLIIVVLIIIIIVLYKQKKGGGGITINNVPNPSEQKFLFSSLLRKSEDAPLTTGGAV